MSPVLAVARDAAGAAVIASVGAALATAVLTARVLRAERAAIAYRPGPAGAILVFGARVHDYGPCAELRSRLDHAAGLWRAGVAPVILTSGGTHGVDEAVGMRQYLIEVGVPQESVGFCQPGTNTRASLDSARELGDLRLVAVSSPYHAHRIAAEARRLGLALVVSAPSDSPDTLTPRRRRVRITTEVLGSAYYWLPRSVARRVHPGRARHVIPAVLTGERRLRRHLTG